MFIPGKTFSENYACLLKIHKALGADGMQELVNKWAADVVDALMDDDPSKSYDKYKVVMSMEPNPITMKGSDRVQIVVMRLPDGDTNWQLVFTSGTHFKVEECIQVINKKIDELLPPPEVVVVNGKRYKLIED